MNKESIKQRLLNKVDIKPSPDRRFDDCWCWTASCNKYGYGQIQIDKKKYKPHRLLAWICELKDPEGNLFMLDSKYHVLHKCDNPPCINVEHLFIGTSLENMRDKEIKGRGNQAKGENNGSVKLTELKVIEIRKHYILKEFSMKELAIKFNISYPTIIDIIARKTWKHV